MTLESDVFIAPLTGDMDMAKFAVAGIVFLVIAIAAFMKLQKQN